MGPSTGRQPPTELLTRVDGDPTLLAGLYEFWRDPALENPEPLVTCTVITTTPSADIDGIHDRMPVVLSHDDVEVWLEVADHSPEERLLLLRPAPTGTLRHYEVDKAVGSVKNDRPELIEPVAPQSLF